MRVYKYRPANAQQLKERIRIECAALQQEYFQSVCDRQLRSRLRFCIQANYSLFVVSSICFLIGFGAYNCTKK